MKRNLIFVMFCAVFFCASVFTSCKDEPTFPDPGIDMTQEQDVVVWRDTAEVYVLTMNVSTPGGLKILEILNANDNALIEDLTPKYAGMEEFVLKYEVKLPDVDTMLNLNVRIVDEQLRALNKQVNIQVKAASRPVIEVVGGLEKSVISPTFRLKARLSTGLNAIQSYKLTFEKLVLDEKVFEIDTNAWDYEFLCNLEMEMDVPYALNLALTDTEGKTTVANIVVTLVSGNQPIKVVREMYRTGQETPHKFLEMYFIYDEDNRVQQLNYDFLSEGEVTNKWNLYFTYNDNGMVTELNVVPNDGGGFCYINEYNEKGEFVKSSRSNSDGEVNPNAVLTVLDWDEAGNVTSYLRGTTMRYENVMYETVENGDGKETVLIDYPDNPYTSSNSFREYFTNNTYAVWPTYNPGLPAFFAENVQTQILDLFCYKYIYENRVTLDARPYYEKGESVAKYTYSTDAKGRVNRVQIEEPYIGWGGGDDTFDYTIYTFEYAD